MLPNRITATIILLIIKIHQELKILIGNNKGITLLFVALFIFIIINNIIGLIPYIFTRTRHITFTITIGTPPLLIPFIVCIETISNIIRPGALAVRLSANMIAGHLLISLLGNRRTGKRIIIVSLILIIQIILIIFETAVAIIQAYVFSILRTLYTREVAYESKT
ncbi:hypothetical protein AAG570_009285 [Ranatra chinensis]|uniref:F-ATPase protein 6 n=1 Tax=Ranatra chinensis TaxID=642074 RepID=A0ABD0YP58_9HEMI